jgi:hypothetical protein
MSSRPRTSEVKNGFSMSEITTAHRLVLARRRLRATPFGR